MRIYDSAGLVKISASNIPIAANPSGLIGLAAVNGSATTFTRSDSTHALDQSIAPTWTSAHIFSAATGTAVTVNATSGNPGITLVGAAGAGTSFGQFIQAGANASDYALRANLKSGLNSLNLAGDGSITFGNTTSNGAYAFNGTGTLTTGGAINAVGAVTNNLTVLAKNTTNGTTAAGQVIVQNDVPNGLRMQMTSSGWSGVNLVNGPTGQQGVLFTDAAFPLSLGTNSTSRLSIAAAGNISINAPSSGTAFVVTGLGNSYAGIFLGAATTGQSYGLEVAAGTNSSDYAFNVINQNSSATYFSVRGDGLVQVGTSGKALQPFVDNGVSLGVGGARWTTVFATTGTINTSDAREKKDIALSDLGLGFILKLRPVSYKWKDPTHTGNGTHYGLIAQEVKQLIGDKAFAGWREDDPEDPDSRQGLNYSEFIAPLIRAIQEQQVRIDALERHCYPKLDFAA